MNIQSNIKKAFVCGYPIKHSRSPLLHGHWLSKYTIDGSYEAIEVAPDNLKGFIASLKDNGFVGGNFTIPHKESIFKLVDDIDIAAQKIGAVNTIWFEDEKLIGSNTDAYGFSKNLSATQPNWCEDANTKTVLVLGAGGASRAIIYALMEKGFKKIILANRTVEKAEGLAKEFSTRIVPVPMEKVPELLGEISLLINTTSIGMNKTDQFPFSIAGLPKQAIVTDIVYTPLNTDLLMSAKAQGNPTVDGLGMLLYQGIPGFEKWFGKRPQVTDELRNLILQDIGGH